MAPKQERPPKRYIEPVTDLPEDMSLRTCAEFLTESNRIEGYKNTADEYLSCLTGTESWADHEPIVTNSVDALMYVLSIRREDITENKILQIHRIQMEGLMPSHTCGFYRQIPVFIKGTSVRLPSPAVVQALMLNWVEKFNGRRHNPFYLHYIFERIHPFVDGNGRVGRLLWALHMLQRYKKFHPILDAYGGEHASFRKKQYAYYDCIDKFSTRHFMGDSFMVE